MAVSCEEFYELINALMDGECTKEEEKLIREHLDACPACATLYQSLQKNAKAVLECTPSLSTEAHLRLLAITQTAKKPKSTAFFTRFRIPAMVAAGLVVCVCAGFAVQHFNAQKSNFGPASGIPAHSGMLYEVETQRNWNITSLYMPKSLELTSNGVGIWSVFSEDGTELWRLQFYKNGTAELSNDEESYRGIALFDQSGSLSALDFSSFVYEVSANEGGLILTRRGNQ